MLLSIVIPVHNKEKYILRLFKSLTRQNIDNNEVEILVIDDDSTDNSIKEIHEFDDKLNIRYFSCEYHNPGLARNIGIENAKGRWITFVDADDYFEDLGLQMVKKFLTLYVDKPIYIIATPFKILDKGNRPVKMHKQQEEQYLHGKFFKNEDFLKTYDLKFPSFLRTHEDLYFNTVANNIVYFTNTFFYLKTGFYVYCMNEDSMTSKTDNVEGHYYIELNLHEFLLAQHEGLKRAAEIFPEHKETFKKFCFTNIGYSYHYFQAFLYLYGLETLINAKAYRDVLTNILLFYDTNIEELSNMLMDEVKLYYEAKEFISSKVCMYIENYSIPFFFDWLYSLEFPENL